MTPIEQVVMDDLAATASIDQLITTSDVCWIDPDHPIQQVMPEPPPK